MDKMRFETDEETVDQKHDDLLTAYFLVESAASKAAIQQEILDYLAGQK